MSTGVAASLQNEQIEAAAASSSSSSIKQAVVEQDSNDIDQSASTQMAAMGSVDNISNNNTVEDGNGLTAGHNDLEAYRNSRRLSRRSSRIRLSASTSRSADEDASPPVQSQEQEKSQHKGAFNCLITLTERIESCSQSIQAWSDRQDEKARLKKNKKMDACVTIQVDGTVMEPKGDSWIERKGIIILVIIILSWVYLVFTWRICTAGIRRESRGLVGREQASM